MSLYFFNKSIKKIFSTIIYFFLILLSFILSITYYISDYFTGNGIDESTVFLLRYGLDGAGFSEYLWLIIITIIIMISGTIFLVWILFKKNKKIYKKYNTLSFLLLLFSLLFNPASPDIFEIMNFDYSGSDEFYTYYKTPKITSISEIKKNLVFIYAESLERTYFYKDLFPGLIKEIKKFESYSISFTDIYQTSGAGTTVSGMTASQLGIPLFTPTYENSMYGIDYFLPGATGLGDLLKKEEYFLSYIGGARSSFAGKGKLFKTHGFSEVLGLEELRTNLKDKNYVNGWGLYDDTLLDIVYERYIELSKTGKKFGLFTLTLDTHAPNGHMSKSCKDMKYKDGSNKMLNAVAGSDFLIARFINKIINSKYADKTIIVLVSDHLSLKNSAYKLLTMSNKKVKKKRLRRRNLFMIIDPTHAHSAKIDLFGTTLDIAPTLLPFIGYKAHIGLGRNILKDRAINTSIRKYINRNKNKISKGTKERWYIFNNVKKWRGNITKFWEFPKLHKFISIQIKEETINIDNRKLQFPILIELNEKMETTLKFAFDITENMKNTTDFLNTIDKDNFFLLIDRGINIKKINKQVDENCYYLIAGKGTKQISTIKLDKDLKFTIKEIHDLIGK